MRIGGKNPTRRTINIRLRGRCVRAGCPKATQQWIAVPNGGADPARRRAPTWAVWLQGANEAMKTWLAIAVAVAMISSCANADRPPAAPGTDTSQMGAAGAAELGFHGPVDRNNAQYGQ